MSGSTILIGIANHAAGAVIGGTLGVAGGFVIGAKATHTLIGKGMDSASMIFTFAGGLAGACLAGQAGAAIGAVSGASGVVNLMATPFCYLFQGMCSAGTALSSGVVTLGTGIASGATTLATGVAVAAKTAAVVTAATVAANPMTIGITVTAVATAALAYTLYQKHSKNKENPILEREFEEVQNFIDPKTTLKVKEIAQNRTISSQDPIQIQESLAPQISELSETQCQKLITTSTKLINEIMTIFQDLTKEKKAIKPSSFVDKVNEQRSANILASPSVKMD